MIVMSIRSLVSFAFHPRMLSFLFPRLQSNTQSVSEADLGALHPATSPYDISKSQNFEIAWPGQFMSSVLTAICYSYFDTFLAVLVLYLCGQLTVLRMALEDPTYATKKNNYAKFYERLRFTVNQDNQLSRLVETIYQYSKSVCAN